MFYPLLDPRNFFEYTLEFDDYVHMSLLTTAALIAVTLISIKHLRHEPRRMAYALSLFNSTILTLVGIAYLAVRFTRYENIFLWKHNDATFYEEKDNFAVAAAYCFGHYLIFDLVVGTIYYPKYMDFWSAYFHHFFYLIFSIIGTTTNGYLFTLPRAISPCFTMCCIEEIPTMIMGLGTIFPQFRTDVGFGVSFLTLRIFYHIFLMCYAIKIGTQPYALFLFISTTGLHLMWAYIWIVKYGLKLIFGDKKKDGKDGKDKKPVKAN